MKGSARVATWNLQWPARRPNERAREIERRIAAADADIFVATECQVGTTPGDQHVLDGGPDWGYPKQEGRRKVQLRSRRPWRPIELDRPLTSAVKGRLRVGTTETPIGDLTVVGVCIPWSDAHVRTGRADRLRWDEHLDYLESLDEVLGALPTPLVVAGDFNQQLPRSRVPEAVHTRLVDVFHGLIVVTAGIERRLIDHVAVTPELTAGSVELISPEHDGRQLSDHLGSVVTLHR